LKESYLTSCYQAFQKLYTNDFGTEKNPACGQCGVDLQDQTSHLAAYVHYSHSCDSKIYMHSAKGQSGELYHAQQGDLHDSLLVKGRLVFYNFHCDIVVSFCIPAFHHLSEGTLAKHFLDNIPNYQNIKIFF
jgi:hypothetical protein